MKRNALHLFFFLLFCLPFAQAQTKHSYRFFSDFKVAQPQCGPDLALAPALGSCAAGTIPGVFVDDALPCGVRRSVYHVNLNWGFMYPNSDGQIGETYTIQLYLKVTNWGPKEWARIIDFSNGTLDNGIYFKRSGNAADRCLDFYPNGVVGECPYFDNSTYYLFTFTRNGATGKMDIYVDNTLFASYTDTAKDYVGKAGVPIYVFRDDQVETCESGEANFAYMAFHNTSFSKSDVDKSFSEICAEANINPTADFSISPNPVCSFPSNVEVKYTGPIPAPGTGYDFQWEWDGAKVISGSGMGPYVLSWDTGGSKSVTLTVTNKSCNNSLRNTKQMIISNLELNTAVTGGSCDSGSEGTITLTATEGLAPYQYSIDSVNYQASNLFSRPVGNYRVFVKDNHNCVVGKNVNVQFSSDILVKTMSDTTICIGQSLPLITESNAQTFSWSPQAGLDNASSREPVATPSATTRYIVTAIKGSCTQTDTVEVRVQPNLDVQVTPDAVIEYNVPYQLTATSPQITNYATANFAWSPPLGLNDPNVQSPITVLQADQSYTVNVTTDLGCVGSATVNLTVKRRENIQVPTAFSPNRDGKNEVLVPIINDIATIRYFRIYNRWGQVVFFTNQLNTGWDGSFKGSAAVSGTYVWEIEGVSGKGAVINKRGSVLLLQ